MLHFIYTYEEKDRKSNGSWHCHKTVKIYKIKRNEPVLIGTLTETYVSEFQLFMMCAEINKAMPKSAFAKHANGSRIYGAAWLLKEAGIASITRI